MKRRWSKAGEEPPAGALRRSQLITTFGAGAMIDLVDRSALVAGLDFWNYEANQRPVILEPRLAARPQKYGPADEKFAFGPPHMIPLAGDWNGDGKDGIGYYNPRTGIFNLRNSLSHGRYAVSFHFGPPHMIPIVGNWTGLDRHDGVGYYNPWAGKFYLRDRAVKGSADAVIRFGPARMTPLAGIWFGG